jgi:hypothetical protein
MFYLSREALKRHLVDDLWKAQAATSAKSIASVILSDKVVDEIKKELRRQTGHIADPARISKVLRGEVINPDAR